MSSSEFLIGTHRIGPANPPLIIAEIAQAHEGSLGIAHSFIDAIAQTGAHAVKFQTHIAAAESTRTEPWRIKFSRQDATRYDYWKRMEFTPDQWAGLKAHAEEKGLLFLSSAFSPEAVELLARLEMQAWKVASGEIGSLPLIRQMAATGKPMLLSSGMSGLAELDAAADVCRAAGNPLAVFQCTTAYPCPPERVGLNVLAQLRTRYDCPVGLSDHSGQIYAGLAATALGASLVEVHVTFSRGLFGPDAPASLEFPELRQLVDGSRAVHSMLAHRVDKDDVAAGLEPIRKVFLKTVVACRDLLPGHVLSESDLTLKKAGGGLPPSRLPELVGRRLAAAVAADVALQESDLASS